MNRYHDREKDYEPKAGNREPAYAGQFYPGSPAVLEKQLTELFREAKPAREEKPRALLAPHAGYMFSGHVAASAFNQIIRGEDYQRVFVLASSHNYNFKGAAVFTEGNYVTPLGEIQVDADVGESLLQTSGIFHYHREAHAGEHSLEVLLPFLQHRMSGKILLVPLILGTDSKSECRQIAEALEPYFTDENLFVISTDFSHYPSFEDASQTDAKTAEALCSNDPDKLLEVLESTRREKIPNLATSMCGWTSVLTLLYLTEKRDVGYNLIEYRNSGSAPRFGDKSRVVGYWAISVTDKEHGIQVNDVEKSTLIKNAKESIWHFLLTGERKYAPAPSGSKIMNEQAGAFVSIYVEGKLRGCIGSFAGDKTLNEVVQSCAVSATEDSRFDALQTAELKDAELEISVLTPMRKIKSIDEIKPGKHGIYMEKGSHSGTFLPQVALRSNWSLTELLGHCSRDKAGIGWSGWKKASVYIYEATVFRGK